MDDKALSSPRPLHKGLGYTVEWEAAEKGTGATRGKAKLFPKASALLGEGPEQGSWPGLRPNFGLGLLNEGTTFLAFLGLSFSCPGWCSLLWDSLPLLTEVLGVMQEEPLPLRFGQHGLGGF